jgi:hypothetical protein
MQRFDGLLWYGQFWPLSGILNEQFFISLQHFINFFQLPKICFKDKAIFFTFIFNIGQQNGIISIGCIELVDENFEMGVLFYHLLHMVIDKIQ